MNEVPEDQVVARMLRPVPIDPATQVMLRRGRAQRAHDRRWRTRGWVALFIAANLLVLLLGLAR